ncbi:MAG TPA: MotA/TolQ/ExbB proton channel family protein [Prolixibacteraceae bacterium]
MLLQVFTQIQAIQNTPIPTSITMFDLLLKGGWILVPIGIISLISCYLIIVKYIEIKRYTKAEPNIVSGFHTYLKSGDLNQAVATLKAGNSSYSRIFYHATRNIGRPIKEVESSIETAAQIEMNKMSKDLHYLGLFAGIAPMLGFIGTIAGVIKIFYDISLADNISIGIISGGLYQKMISSGLGLIVGVIAYTGYHMLNIMIDKYMNGVEEDAFEFINLIEHK